MKLLGVAVSPFALRVRMALQMKGVGYEYIEQDLFNKSELLVASNPVHKKVPVLIHGSKPICESSAIVQYVDEAWATGGPSILPADPYQRAVARFWAAYVDDKVFPAWVAIMRAATEEERAEKLAAAQDVVELMEGAFAECSGDGEEEEDKDFFGGDSVGYVDLALGSNLFWFQPLHEMFGVTVIDAGKAPRLAAWAERFLETEVAKVVAPAPGSVVEYAGKLSARRLAAAAAAANK